MGDLSDEELALLGGDDPGCECIFCRSGDEIRRHRAAQAADAERVRAVVGAELRDWLPADALTDSEIGRIADGVAAQLTAPALCGCTAENYPHRPLLGCPSPAPPPPGHVCPVSYGLGPEDLSVLEYMRLRVEQASIGGRINVYADEAAVLGKILAAHRAPAPTTEPLPEVIACGTAGCVSSIKKHLLPAGWLLLDGTWRCPRCKVIATSEAS